ncbi:MULTISPECIES: LLM class F420-dependent oxidoreductase [unclassified Crossiella]|uniref:LLM class F420-dependent oxidoreductase n=1 Tax=unclassified Crossiella TaxID=2620835 RepID=UPI001FFFDC09|nr:MULTISPECIES: LLM class F420-dependent oxidoreductase [unclassified Crossiella]MCK2241942.1 LLM class F420-dependent oxidoreductase [Crossiella sp. S99.2]MCK2255845.1 LLM class F420-dependent oxidoreductase [Crossiella sp. S99.1]
MDLSVQGLNLRHTVDPEQTTRLARLAEDLGMRGWWASEHVVLPSPAPADTPMNPLEPILDPLVHLSFVAAVTQRLELGTAIIILPQRNPVVLAKQVASLDHLSRGRFTLGVGAGYLEPEMTAVGVPMSERGARTDEYLDAMNALWRQDAPSFDGKFARFANVDAHPKPADQRIVVGGHSPAAYRRAVSRGHGWYGVAGNAEDLHRSLAGLRKAADQVDRPERLGRLRIHLVQSPTPPTQADAEEYRELGVDELVLFPTYDTGPDEIARELETFVKLG